MPAQTPRVCPTHVGRFSRLRGGDGTGPWVVLCDRATSRGPRPRLFNEAAERFPRAREAQVWGRGRTRPADSAIGRAGGAGARVPAPRREQGERPRC
jgi:hypothetical protein